MSIAPIDHTHDPARSSWVGSANQPDNDFPLQNLPFGRLRRQADDAWSLGVAIGNQILDLAAASAAGLALHPTLAAGDLSGFMALGPAASRAARYLLFDALAEGSPLATALAPCLVPQDSVQMGLPCDIRGYSDFFTGIHHARQASQIMMPGQPPLPPNYQWVPIAYHGRASSIVPSGTAVRRPCGQISVDGQTASFGPSLRLDYELEVGALVGRGNALGDPIPICEAEQHWFGLVLLNDWSARDIQQWESRPLGPFLAKNFATSISPWVVTREALAPFRVPAPQRPMGDPAPLPYLHDDQDMRGGGIDLTLEVWLQSRAMTAPHRLMQSHFCESAYWTVAQMVAHHTSNGCNLLAGDLLGTGTQSGPTPDQAGCLLELTQGGASPITLPNGERRAFLEDGDQVILRGHCQRGHWRRIGFGDCAGQVRPTS